MHLYVHYLRNYAINTTSKRQNKITKILYNAFNGPEC